MWAGYEMTTVLLQLNSDTWGAIESTARIRFVKGTVTPTSAGSGDCVDGN